MPKRWRVFGAYLRIIAPVNNTAPFEEILQRKLGVGNTLSDLTGPRYEHQTFRSRDKHVVARPTGKLSSR